MGESPGSTAACALGSVVQGCHLTANAAAVSCLTALHCAYCCTRKATGTPPPTTIVFEPQGIFTPAANTSSIYLPPSLLLLLLCRYRQLTSYVPTPTRSPKSRKRKEKIPHVFVRLGKESLCSPTGYYLPFWLLRGGNVISSNEPIQPQPQVQQHPHPLQFLGFLVARPQPLAQRPGRHGPTLHIRHA